MVNEWQNAGNLDQGAGNQRQNASSQHQDTSGKGRPRSAKEYQGASLGKRLWSAITTIVVAVVVVLAVSMVAFRLVGGGTFAVLSASMEPQYPVGSLIYVKPVDPAQLQVGDVITFAVADDITVTHRIAGIDTDSANANERWFTTKGDANSTPDAAPVRSANVIGTPVFHIPLLGFIVSYIMQPPGLYVAIGLVALLAVAGFAPALVKGKHAA